MLSIVLGDITQRNTEVIVNAANSQLMRGGGVCGAIHEAAGPALMRECGLRIKEIPGYMLPTGEGILTEGFRLSCMIYHVVGPMYNPRVDQSDLLARCYQSTFEVMEEHGYKSVAFPSISTGIFGYPLDEAVPIAVKELKKQEDKFEIEVVCFDEVTYTKYNKEVF